MTTVLDLVANPSVRQIEVEDYDFNTQIRFNSSPQMGFPTSGTVATFDFQGRPNDSRSDQD